MAPGVEVNGRERVLSAARSHGWDVNEKAHAAWFTRGGVHTWCDFSRTDAVIYAWDGTKHIRGGRAAERFASVLAA